MMTQLFCAERRFRRRILSCWQVKELFSFRRFAQDSRSILAGINRLALVGIELTLNLQTSFIQPLLWRFELSIAEFADANHGNVNFEEPEIAFWHGLSLAARTGLGLEKWLPKVLLK